MTRAEAEGWALGSVYRAPVYHVTTIDAAPSIRAEGFDLGRRAGGRAWGDGVYAATDDATRRAYLEMLGDRGIALELRVNLRRFLRVEIVRGSRTQPFWQILIAVPDGTARFLEARRLGNDVPGALRHVITDAGYDALEIVEGSFSWLIGGNQLVVFDPRRIVVVSEDE